MDKKHLSANQMEITGWLIDPDKPFCGRSESFLIKDSDGIETVAYTNRLTLEEYEKEKGKSFKIINDDEFNDLIESYENSLRTSPEEIAEDQFYEAFECLPPCRYHVAGDWNVFYMSETRSGNLVGWYAQGRDGRFWYFVDYATADTHGIILKLQEATFAAPRRGGFVPASLGG